MLLASCGSGDDGDVAATTSVAGGSTATTTAAAPLPEIVLIDAAEADAIESEPDPDCITIAGDSAWVAGVGDGVGRYDLASGELLATVPVPGQICLAMDAGFDSLWVGDCTHSTVVRVDTESGEVLSTISTTFENRLAPESSIAAGADGVWVISQGDDDPPTRPHRPRGR